MAATPTVEETLAKAPIFSRLSKRSLEKLAGSCVRRSYAPGEMLLEEGDLGLGMILVVEGRIEVFKGRNSERVVLATVGPGEILGEMALLDDQPRSASAAAVDAAQVLLLSRDSFRAAAEKDPDLLWSVVPILTERLRQLQERALDTAESAAGERTPPADQQAGAAPAGERASSGSRVRDAVSEESLVKALRVQYAVMRSGLAGMSGMVRAGEAFLDALDKETGLRDAKDLDRLWEKVPDGMARATRAAISESEGVPDEMLEVYRRHAREGA